MSTFAVVVEAALRTLKLSKAVLVLMVVELATANANLPALIADNHLMSALLRPVLHQQVFSDGLPAAIGTRDHRNSTIVLTQAIEGHTHISVQIFI